MNIFRTFLTSLILLHGGMSPGSLSAAESYLIADNQTGTILASKNAQNRMQVASLTKVATAVVVLDAADLKMVSLNDRATVSSAATRSGGINPAGLIEGDSLTIRDLLYAALMASDNVAAATLADHLGRRLPNATRLDPIGNFVAHMNALARNLRMRRTLFLNPHGMDNLEGSLPYSTAADMARLTRYAYSEGDFRFFVSQASRDIEVQRGGESMKIRLTNTNQLVGKEGIDGVKTGRTNRSGDCLILSSWQNPDVVKHDSGIIQTPRRIIVVLLRSPDRFGEGSTLLRQGWSLYNSWAAQGRPVNKSKML